MSRVLSLGWRGRAWISGRSARRGPTPWSFTPGEALALARQDRPARIRRSVAVKASAERQRARINTSQVINGTGFRSGAGVRSQFASDEGGNVCWIGEAGQKGSNLVSNEASTKVKKQLGDTIPLQTLAKGDKLTVTVEGIDGGKLRCTGATWTDAVIIFPDEVLAFQNIERQARALRAPAPGGVVQTPRRHPRSR
jgi:hypothetical protein